MVFRLVRFVRVRLMIVEASDTQTATSNPLRSLFPKALPLICHQARILGLNAKCFLKIGGCCLMSIKILGLLFAGFKALCTQLFVERLSSMKKYVFGLGSVQEKVVMSSKQLSYLKSLVSILCLGEVSLPGGKTEEGDKDDGDTATREAKEEIGLDPKLGINIDALVSLYWKVKTKAGNGWLGVCVHRAQCQERKVRDIVSGGEGMGHDGVAGWWVAKVAG
ncbi:hypothetical protein EV1_039454 [Malus domestica]